jgi:hypothetical protein
LIDVAVTPGALAVLPLVLPPLVVAELADDGVVAPAADPLGAVVAELEEPLLELLLHADASRAIAPTVSKAARPL